MHPGQQVPSGSWLKSVGSPIPPKSESVCLHGEEPPVCTPISQTWDNGYSRKPQVLYDITLMLDNRMPSSDIQDFALELKPTNTSKQSSKQAHLSIAQHLGLIVDTTCYSSSVIPLLACLVYSRGEVTPYTSGTRPAAEAAGSIKQCSIYLHIEASILDQLATKAWGLVSPARTFSP